MKCMIFWILISLCCSKVSAFEYDERNLPKDFRAATDIVIAKKVSGIISYASLTEEIDSFQKHPINWRESPAWDKLQERNRTKSTFLVLNSIQGDFSVGDEFEFEDSWIPVELGSVMLYFLFKKDGSTESNPCHRIGLKNNKNEIVKLSHDAEKLIDFILKKNLSFCAKQKGNSALAAGVPGVKSRDDK